jgi:glycerophosphoryl diester phosphodiesterase
VIIFGHRGSPGFPRFGENTARSFRKALSQGATGLEFDVRRCAGGTIVVIHDATVDRTTNGKGRVADLSYQQLSQFDAGDGDRIPLLSDVLEEFGPRCVMNIELKESGLAGEVASMVLQRRLTETVILSAFDSDDNDADSHSSWDDLSLVADRIPIALLATKKKLDRIGASTFIQQAQHRGARAIHPQRASITAELMDAARKASLAVRVWTVNDPSEAAALNELGVDAIVTDNPSTFNSGPHCSGGL